MVDPTQTPPPPGGRGGGGGGTNVNSGCSNNNPGRGSGFTMPEMPSFMTNNNFNGGIGYGRGDPNNNLYGFGYGYPFDSGYGNSRGGGQNNSLQVNVQKLDGSNYPEWSQTVRLILEGKGKLGFLTGDVLMPATTHPNYRFWKSENSSIIA
ncbi:putative glycine-rich cell wall structural protein 1 [Trifolium pratense]|uniref:putative glycine-rich cell wall structural protein 1 n=1 Tax=Trifolium pratense TaxID=57577 RepID=UPI001E695333|nr:putative glycine-rich cell wall structural protein 1 [Trifolium pratense]